MDDSGLWATADETREQIIGFYRRTWAHTDATIDELPLDADILREALDGRTGTFAVFEGQIDVEARAAFYAKVEQAARPATEPTDAEASISPRRSV